MSDEHVGVETMPEVVTEPLDPETISPTVPALPLPVIAVTLAALLLSVFFLFCKAKASRGNKVLLLGPVGSGKTALYLRYRFGRTPPTVTSMVPNSAAVAISDEQGGAKRTVFLIDTPGSGRLRGHLFGELAGAAALVCVIDGTALAAHAKEAAQLLYDVLTHESVERSPPPLLIAVNKSDMAGAMSPAAARKALETEVTRVRLARTTMQDTSERSRPLRGIAAGDTSQPFSFEQLGSSVEFVSCSAVKPELRALSQFVLHHTR